MFVKFVFKLLVIVWILFVVFKIIGLIKLFVVNCVVVLIIWGLVFLGKIIVWFLLVIFCVNDLNKFMW